MKNNRSWSGVPPWIFIGALAVLFPVFAFMIKANINHYEKNSTRLLVEKGAALIRSLEAGTRTEMMGACWDESQLQRLFTEIAHLPDITYILLANTDGTILVHDESGHVGKIHGNDLNLRGLTCCSDVRWRVVTGESGQKIFEVFRSFSPVADVKTASRCPSCQKLIDGWALSHDKNLNKPGAASLIIFLGLDMSTIEETKKADSVQAVVMGLILLLIGFAGIMLLFLAQSYRSANASLSRIRAFSDNLVENMPIGLFATDSNGKLVSFNQAAESALSLSSDGVIGKEAEAIIPSDLWQLTVAPGIRQGVVEKEINCSVGNGNMIPLDVSAAMLRDESGTFFGYIVLFKDLTELRALRREIARSQRLASVGSLAAGVAHEIRNPLSSIKGFATYFKERYRDVPEDQQIAGIMIQETDRLNRVIGQLLELAKPVTISGCSVEGKALIEESLRLVEQQASEMGVRIQTAFSPGIGKIFADRDRMRQVLLNLCLNALESMKAGGTLSVEMLKKQPDDGIEIRVSDTGTGISEKDLGCIFDPYFTTKSSGTGLGLAIVHNILEAHGGKIKVESCLGQGSCITVFLPFSPE